MDNKLWHFMTLEEEHEYFNEVCDRVILNPRFYLDNLDNNQLSVFKVNFINYKTGKFKNKRKVYKAEATQ
jgi:hypothetical protein